MHLQCAFEQVCKEAKEPDYWYVVLVDHYQAYGGPEEGGWWYTVSELAAYQQYPSEEAAEAAAAAVESLAAELRAEAQAVHGDYCLRTMEWLEARGLDADFLPEPDGPKEFSVRVCEELPVFDNRRPQYC